MIQLFAYDDAGERYELDLYESNPIKINVSAEDIIDIPRVDSAFSRQFRIPATSNNSKFFKWWYTAGSLDFDITQKVQSEIHVDGLLYRKGQLRMTMVFDNTKEDRIDIEVVFLGETKEFSTQIGDGFMNLLDVSDIDHILDHTNMHNTQLPFGDPSLFLDGKVRYGLGVRGYSYDADGNILENGQLNMNNSVQKSFRQQANHLQVDQYVPFLQVKYLVDKIFEQTDFTYSDNSVFNEDWFRYLYIDGIADVQTVTPSTNGDSIAKVGSTYSISSSGPFETVKFDTIVSDPSNCFNTSTHRYTLGVAATSAPFETVSATVQIADQYDFFSGSGASYTVNLYKKSGAAINLVDTTTQTAGAGFPGSQYFLNISVSITGTVVDPFADGDQFWCTVSAVGGSPERPVVTDASYFQVINTVDAVRGSTLLRDNVKTIEFFKSILAKFRLVMVPSKAIQNEFIIKPWKDYIATGDFFDWTEKLDVSKDRILKPVFFDQSGTILYRDQEGADYMNINHQDQYNDIYGHRIYDSQNDLLKNNREVTTIFAPTPVNQVPGYDPTNNTLQHTTTFILPYFCKESEETDKDGLPKLLPIKTRPRLMFWNGMRPTTNNDSIGFYDTTSPGEEHKEYSAFSYLSEMPSTVDTLDLNWKKDIQYFELNPPPLIVPPSGSLGQDVFERYWDSYIASLYSPEARMMTAYFVIDNEDMRNLTFDDVIFVKDTYWRLHKIIDAPLGNIDSVKVELIKLIDYIPEQESPEVDPGDYTGDLTFEDADVTFGNATGAFGGTPVNQYYSLLNCEGPGETAIGSYPGFLAPGTSVWISGSGNLDKCWEVVGSTTSQSAIPILQVYPDCTTCLASI